MFTDLLKKLVAHKRCNYRDCRYYQAIGQVGIKIPSGRDDVVGILGTPEPATYVFECDKKGVDYVVEASPLQRTQISIQRMLEGRT